MKRVAIIGSGPAALMVADTISQAGMQVSLFEKRKGAARKLLIAGSSGLNISNSLPLDEFKSHYTGPIEFWDRVLNAFTPQDWLNWIHELGLKTFEGSSGRYFVEDMKAASLSHAWTERLKNRGVQFHFDHEFSGFIPTPDGYQIHFKNGSEISCDVLCLCLGGASYEPQENPLRWVRVLEEKELKFTPFRASNVGFKIGWPTAFLKEAEGLPLKNFVLKTKKGSRKGEAVITNYGIEGTPVYAVGITSRVTLDLKPDLTIEEMLKKCRALKENFSPLRRVKKTLNLGPAALALIFHLTPIETQNHLEKLILHIKDFPLDFLGPQPIEEAISSSGGLALEELDSQIRFMLKKFPGIFAAGEMLDWDAPTGGFLIQACVSQGRMCGENILNYLNNRDNLL